ARPLHEPAAARFFRRAPVAGRDSSPVYFTLVSHDGRRKRPSIVPAAASRPSSSNRISRLPNGSDGPAMMRRMRPFSHSNCRISPLASSSTICSRTLHNAPLGLIGMASSLPSISRVRSPVRAMPVPVFLKRIHDTRGAKFTCAAVHLERADREPTLCVQRDHDRRRAARSRRVRAVGERRAHLLRPCARQRRHDPVAPARAPRNRRARRLLRHALRLGDRCEPAPARARAAARIRALARAATALQFGLTISCRSGRPNGEGSSPRAGARANIARMSLLYRRTEAGRKAWDSQASDVPLEYRRVLGLFVHDTDPRDVRATLGWSEGALNDVLEELEEKGMLERYETDDRVDLDFTGSFSAAGLNPLGRA